MRGYQALEILVPKFNGEGFVIQNARCTRLKAFRGGRRSSNWIWVRIHRASKSGRLGALNGRMPARLNAKYKIGEMGRICRQVHVTMLQCVGGTLLQGTEVMVRVGWPTRNATVIVKIAQIEAMAHLIPM